LHSVVRQKAFENGNPNEIDNSIYWFAETGDLELIELSKEIDKAALAHPALRGKYHGSVKTADATVIDEDLYGEKMVYICGGNSRGRYAQVTLSLIGIVETRLTTFKGLRDSGNWVGSQRGLAVRQRKSPLSLILS
jgi:hypothetical protein